LYGELLVGPPNRPPEVTETDDASSKSKPRQGGDDMFSDAPKAGAPGPADADKKADSSNSSAALPSASFSAAKLMMPPVRKKAEANPNKRPMPAFDIGKLQEEKEALMRQRAAAAAQENDKPSFATNSTSSSPASGFVRASGGGGAAAGDEAVATRESLYGSPDEEYDPAKPNDYDEFCRRRMRLKAEEELEKRRQEAIARSQKGQMPAEPKEDDFATKMLKKMGWKEGSGLGKEGQGMTAPLILKKTDSRQGSIVEGQKREAPAAQPQAQPVIKQAKVAQRPPSCILLLNNLVGAGEVDEDLEGETAEEAGKYGKLVKCVVREMKGLPDVEAVRIFLEFEEIASATKALVDMNGRYFGGRVVKARYFDPARFTSGDLDKRQDE